MISDEYNEQTRTYFNSIKKYKPLSLRQEQDYFKRWKTTGDIGCMNKLITSNLKYGVKLSKQYRSRGVPFADLISEANMGLFHALEKYDPSKNIKLSTYASWWQKERIQKAIKRESRYTPLIEPAGESKYIDKYIEVDDMSPFDGDKEEEADMPLDHTGDAKIVLGCLDEREQDIIKSRFGFGLKEEMPLKDIAKKYGISTERVRQIVTTALTKMRSYALDNDIEFSF